MPLTIKGIYENGKIKLLEKPPKNVEKMGVYIQFVQFPVMPVKKAKLSPVDQFNLEKFRKVLKKTRGIMKNLPSGTSYENRLRDKLEKELTYDW